MVIWGWNALEDEEKLMELLELCGGERWWNGVYMVPYTQPRKERKSCGQETNFGPKFRNQRTRSGADLALALERHFPRLSAS